MLSLLFTLCAAVLPQGSDQDHLYDQLQEEERVTPEVRIVQAVVPCVVFIETETKQRNSIGMLFSRTYAGSGSGVVVHQDGYIVTNYHVVAGASTIKVSFARIPGQFDADLVSFQRTEDLALLRIRGGGDFPTVRLGTSSDLLEAERVVAIGNPYGQTHTVSKGIISGLHRDVRVPDQSLVFTDLIQTDASINFGNSGGPLLNIRGELIGINTAMNSQAENIGFAIPVDRVKDVLNDILFPQARKSWLGFELASGGHLTVGKVWSEGPAAEAGICSGDQVLALGAREVSNPDEFLHASLELEPREQVEIRVRRGSRTETVTIASWDRLDGLLFERAGMTLREEAVGRGNWLFVDRVEAGSPAAMLGLEVDDLIPYIRPGNGAPTYEVRNRQRLVSFLRELPSGAEIDLEVFRDENDDNYFSREERYLGSLALR